MAKQKQEQPERALVLVDIENLAGQQHEEIDPQLANAIVRSVLEITELADADHHVIVGCDRTRGLEVGLALTSYQLVVGMGRNGADRALERAVDVALAAERYSYVVLASGDADFLPLVGHLNEAGLRVVLVAWRHSVSRDLRKSADEFRRFDKSMLQAQLHALDTGAADADHFGPAMHALRAYFRRLTVEESIAVVRGWSQVQSNVAMALMSSLITETAGEDADLSLHEIGKLCDVLTRGPGNDARDAEVRLLELFGADVEASDRSRFGRLRSDSQRAADAVAVVTDVVNRRLAADQACAEALDRHGAGESSILDILRRS